MKSNKLKRCILSNSENSIDTINLSQVLSNSNLNSQFWNSLRETIHMKKESETIKARIFTAKRILTPIIQELMKDTLKQIEAETLDEEGVERENSKELNGKEIKVLYNNLKAGDIWHVQEDVFTDGEEWAMKILREISRDFERPFDELHENIEINVNEQQSNKDIVLNENLLTKLITIHQHLGSIIKRLNQRCRKRRTVDTDDSLNNLSNQKVDIDTTNSSNIESSISRKMNEQKINPVTMSLFGLIHQKVGYPTQKQSLSIDQSRQQLKVEHACSVMNLGNVEKGTYSMSKKLLYDVAVSYNALFEENKNSIGNKEIVIKCLDDLEKVRNYLEAIRDNKVCNKPEFCDLESCKNDCCLESQPHLHSNLHNIPMVLKLNKHAEDEECNSDLIIGIPTRVENSPDVHILLNTKEQHIDDKNATEHNIQSKNLPKSKCRISRIPKPINKKRFDLQKSVKSKSMKITLENKESSRRKPANLLIFDPDDPCKSIIKMMEQKKDAIHGSRPVVSKAYFTLIQKKNSIIYLIICCLGGEYIVWLLIKWFFKVKHSFSDSACFYLVELHVFICIPNFLLSFGKPRKMTHSLNPPERKFYCFIHKDLWKSKCHKFMWKYLDKFIHHLISLAFFIEVFTENNWSYKDKLYEKNFYRKKDINKYLPRIETEHIVYFFQCFKENKATENTEFSSQRRWNQRTFNSTVNPIWTIKRSKYYSVPQSTKKNDENVSKKRDETGNCRLNFKVVDSLVNIKGSRNEINLQMSEVSLHSSEFPKLETGSDKMCQKNEIKRKVSFREEVDVSEPDVDKEDQDPDSQKNNDLAGSHDEYIQHQSNDVEYKDRDMQEDIMELSTRIPDLLMTESLLKIAEDMPKYSTKMSKQTLKKSSPKGLNLTESARHVLEKLSRSFEQEQYGSISSIVEKNFYDETGKRISEIRDSHGDLLYSLKNQNLNSLSSVLFGSGGELLKNRYDTEGRQIKSVYDGKGRLVSRIQGTSDEMKSVQADLGVTQYYDFRGKPINHLYDSSGYEINTIGRDLTSKIFDADGRLQMDIYTRGGRRIDAVYDCQGRLLGRVSYSQLEPRLRTEQVRVANMDEDSLNKLFESENKAVRFTCEDMKEDENCPKRFFDQEGNPLIGVYDKKGKPLKVTSSGEADELLPFLFNNKGKLQSKRYDSKGKELKAVFGENGKAISEMSIAWLNDLLGNSKNNIPKIKKKESFFKKISIHRTKKEKLRDIDKLFDSKGNIITGVFDSEGQSLAVSLSGEAEKLLPFLFDKGGKFIKKRYDSGKRKLSYVYGKDGKKIRTISATYLENIAAKLVSRENKKKCEHEKHMGGNANDWSSAIDSQNLGCKIDKTTESDKDLSYFEKVPDQLFDVNGNLLTEIFDNEGKLLRSSSSGNAWKLLPHLFDENGKLLKGRFDKQGKELLAVYNKEGNILNDILSTAIKIAADEALEYNDYRNESKDSNAKEDHIELTEEHGRNLKTNGNYETKPKPNKLKSQKKLNNDCNKRKGSVSKLATTLSKGAAATLKISSKFGAIEPSTSNFSKLNPQGEKSEKKQLKPTTSITMKQSMNQKFDPEITAKAGQSIDKFYDGRGNIITEVCDAQGRVLVEARNGDVEKLAKFLFDKDGFLHENVYDHEGIRITQIFDHKKRSVSRISVASFISGATMSKKPKRKDKKLSGSVYDKNGFLIKEIYDKKGHPIIITRHAKLQDLAPIIFDEKGVRRRIYNKSGNEIGPIYDHKGNVLKYSPFLEKPKLKQDCKESYICSKSGKPLRNFYDSDGTLIIALFNDFGQTLCSVKKGVDNVDLLSKFFFDKNGNFLRDRFFNYRGQMIKHVYDCDGNIISTIRRTKSRKISHHKSTNRRGDKRSPRSNIENSNRLNLNLNFTNAPKKTQKGYNEKNEVRPVGNIIRILSSHSDVKLNPEAPRLQRAISAYSLRDYPVRNELGEQSSSSSMSSLTNFSVKKFYDENGRLLTGVYNSKDRLLGYSASGNARVLAPYLFDNDGTFISGRYNLSRKPLRHVYDSDGKMVEKMSKLVLKNAKEFKRQSNNTKGLHDVNGNVISSIYDLRGKKILDIKDSWDEIENLLDENGEFKKNLFNCRGSELKFHKNGDIPTMKSTRKLSLDKKRRHLHGKRYQKEVRLKGRSSALSNFKDKILTVIFDNQNRICDKIPFPTAHKRTKIKTRKNIDEQARCKSAKTFLYDGDSKVIEDIYDERGKRITKVFNSDGKVISELYSISGTLMKKKVLESMFEDNVFRPKAYNSEGNMITTIFANKKLLKKVYDEKGAPAKVESDLVYLVSKQSLPIDEAVSSSKTASKHVNYFSEGSTYPFPERQNQNSQVQDQQLIGKIHETEIQVAFNGYSRRRTDDCTCEYCQKKGNDRKSIVEFGGEILDRLSRFTNPLMKFLPRAFLRRETRQDSEELVGDLDSLETLIDEVKQQSEEVGKMDKEYYGSCSRVSLLESDDNIPISRKLVEKTLRKCVHLNSSTDVIGKVSDTVLHHFANLILQEIEQKFYHKLNILQCGRSSSIALDRDLEKDTCIGTEINFEDSLIGKHFSAQTIDLPVSSRTMKLYEYFSSKLDDRDGDSHKVLQYFVMMMNTKVETHIEEW